MTNWTVGRKIGAGFAVPLVILVAVSGVSYTSMNRLVESVWWQSHTHEVLTVLQTLSGRLGDAQRGSRGFVLTEQEATLKPYQKAVSTLPGDINRLADLTRDNPGQQKRIEELRPVVSACLAEIERYLTAYRTQGRQAAVEAIKTGQAAELFDRSRGLIDEMIRNENELLAEREEVARAAVRNAHATLIGGTVAAVGLVGLLGWGITRSVTRPVRGVIAQLGATGTELLASTHEQAAGAQEQAAAVAQTVTTVDEVTQTSDQAAQRAKGVGDAIRRTHEIGRAGRKGVEDAIRALAVVRDKMEATAETILALAEQAQAIGEIIATVNDIAEQTNVLALNAAIEASRAGHEGRGFAVVAGEVKSLADQSKKATAQVRKILGEVQKATNAAVLSTEDVSKGVAAAAAVAGTSGDTIRALADTLADAAQAVEHVVASAGQQAIGMTQIHQAMRNIETVARQNVAAVQQTEAAARGLSAQGERLAALVGH